MSSVTKRKVLFVDDDKDWREMVSGSLGAAGFDVLTAANSSEAMRQGTDPSLSLMIVDEDLAGESGRMLSRFLRHNNPDVPTVLYTRAESGANTPLDMRLQAADQCLPKGSIEELIVNVGYFVR